MATVASLVPRITVHAYNAPVNFIKQSILESAREFCKQTRYWREELAAVDTVVDQSSYTLTLPVDSEVVDFSNIFYGTKRQLTPKTSRQLDVINNGWRAQKGSSYYYYREGNDGIRLVYTPEEVIVDAIQATAILQPTLTATSIDDKILVDYDETIIHGALYRILRIPGRTYSDLKTANYYEGLFRGKLDEAESRGTDGRIKGVIRISGYGGL